MTRFDYAVLAIFLLSGLLGLARGVTRELTTLFAFLGAGALSLMALHFTGPLARHAIHVTWLADAAAVLTVFLVLYVVLRLTGGMLTRGVRQTVLSGPDRLLGLSFGVLRGWVAVGLLALLIDAAMPLERPTWITGAQSYPLAQGAAATLRRIAPRGLKLARDAAPAVDDGARPAADRLGVVVEKAR